MAKGTKSSTDDGAETRVTEIHETFTQISEIQSQQGTDLAKQGADLAKQGAELVLLNSKFDGLNSKFDGLNSKFDELLKFLKKPVAEDRSAPLLPTPTSALIHSQSKMPSNPVYKDEYEKYEVKHPKLDFPHFDGVDPRGWIRKCERYFHINKTPEEHKVGLAEIYLTGLANSWYGGWCTDFTNPSWMFFSKEICRRFCNKSLDDVLDEFEKLKQVGTVEDYLAKYEDLKSLVKELCPGLPDTYYTNRFVAGLRDDIRPSLRISTPGTTMRAIELARAQEATSDAIILKARGATRPPFNPTSIPLKPPDPPATIKKVELSNYSAITQAQLQEKRAKGLCFRCDEKFVPGHKCKNKELNFILTEGENDFAEVIAENVDHIIQVKEDDYCEFSQLSLSTLTGQQSSSTIRIKGILKKKTITILIDTGSSQTFIDEKLAKELSCVIEPTKIMRVTVANGGVMVSDKLCPNLPWLMEGHRFTHDVRLIELGGCDMVLGVDWLKKFSPLNFDFDQLQVSFKKDGKDITLKSSGEAQLGIMSCKSLANSIKEGTADVLGCLYSIQTSDEDATAILGFALYQGILNYPNSNFIRDSTDLRILFEATDGYIVWGRVPYEQHLFKEALVSFVRTSELKSTDVKPYFQAGNCTYVFGRHGEAKKKLQKDIQKARYLNPDHVDAMYKLRRLYMDMPMLLCCYVRKWLSWKCQEMFHVAEAFNDNNFHPTVICTTHNKVLRDVVAVLDKLAHMHPFMVHQQAEVENFVWYPGFVHFHLTTLRTRWLLRGRICHES